MLVPICNERLPVRIEVSVLSAKGLPVMNKSINSTDAFVEVRFADESEKTEVVTSLNPLWNSDNIPFDTDEKELLEESLQFRVMDHDTYSTNDEIGRVYIDCNMLIENMRMKRVEKLHDVYSFPIYDTLHGIRGELSIHLEIHLLHQYSFKNYVQIFSGYHIPSTLKVIEVFGLVSDIKVEKDPDFEWLDKIRTPRATNEARLSAIRDMKRSSAISVAGKAERQLCNFVVGFQEHLDVEGSSTDLLTLRTFGTAIRVSSLNDLTSVAIPSSPLLSIYFVPGMRNVGAGSLLSVRSVRIFLESDEAKTRRKAYWSELRGELFKQALSVGCNVVVCYNEQVTINEGVGILTCTGTAIKVIKGDYTGYSVVQKPFCTPEQSIDKEVKTRKDARRVDSLMKPVINCELFHTTLERSLTNEKQNDVNALSCNCCENGKVVDFLITAVRCPPSAYHVGPRSFIQASVTKKLANDPSDREDYCQEISNALPFADQELINQLLAEAKNSNPHANAIFDVKFSHALSDDLVVSAITGILVRLACIPKDDLASPALSNVLSFGSLQKQDPRRFSWGTVREAIRFRPSPNGNVALKVLNLRTPLSESLDESSNHNKGRLRIGSWVGKFKRRQHEKEYMSHILFERQISASIGFIEPQLGGNISAISGLHLSQNFSAVALPRDAENVPVSYRWSDIFVREDLITVVRDSPSIDAFLTNAVEERITYLRSVINMGGLHYVSNLKFSCPQFTVSKDHAHIVILMSCDIHPLDYNP